MRGPRRQDHLAARGRGRPGRGRGLGRAGRRRPRQGEPDRQQRRRCARRDHRLHVLRGLRVAVRDQLLGRRVRDQGVPAAPEGLGRGPRGEHLQRLRPHQRAVAVGLQRGEVRRPGLHRRAAHGTGDRRRTGLGDHRPPRRHQDQHRQARPHRPEPRGDDRRPREGPARLREGLLDQPRQGGPADPDCRATGQAPRPHRPGRQGVRLRVAVARRVLPAHRGEGRQGSAPTEPPHWTPRCAAAHDLGSGTAVRCSRR